MLKLIPRIPWWLLYCVFKLHEKAYATSRLRDWEYVPMSRLGYVVGWLCWAGLAITVFLLVKS
jgi:hypothetical protein